MIIGTAGHIDHGKTALVRALTGVDTDRLKEEKERGITIELGFAYQPVTDSDPDGPRIGFVDMPGHEKFIHTMLAGASGIGMALLVIAADDGVMPQTREHLQILQLLGIAQGAIVITKIDAVEPARVAEVEQEVRALVAGSFLAEAPLFACSALRGDGIASLREYLHQAALAYPPLQQQSGSGAALFRLAVDRCFAIEGRGTIVTGTVHAGGVRIGDSLQLLPSSRDRKIQNARVRSLHVNNQKAEHGTAGQRVALNLAGISHTDIHRGDWIVAEATSHRTERVSVMLTLLPDAKILKHWSSVHVHAGAAHTMARIALLEGETLNPGHAMLAELSLDIPLHLCHGDRLVLRDASARETIAGCEVLDVFPPTRAKRSAARLALLRSHTGSSAADALRALLDTEKLGTNLSHFSANRNLPLSALPAFLDTLDAIRLDTADGLYACAAPYWTAIRTRLLDELAVFHEREPDNIGVERERLRRRALPTLPADVFAAALQGLLDEGCVTAQRSFIALPTHKVTLTDAEQQLWSQVMPLLNEVRFHPPRVRPLAKDAAIDEPEMRRFLGKTARLGLTYLVAHDHYFLADAVRELAVIVQTLVNDNGHAKAAPFRDRISTGRKLAIEILEFFDRTGYTRRIAEHHVIRQPQMWKE